MIDQKNFIKPISTPCIRKCKLDSNDICVGCGRTKIDIMLWYEMSEERRLEIMSVLNARITKQTNKCEKN